MRDTTLSDDESAQFTLPDGQRVVLRDWRTSSMDPFADYREDVFDSARAHVVHLLNGKYGVKIFGGRRVEHETLEAARDAVERINTR